MVVIDMTEIDQIILSIFIFLSLLFCFYIRYQCSKEMKRIDKELEEIGIDTSEWK